MSTRFRALAIAATVIVVLCFASTGFTQTETATVSGRVTDVTGAVVQGAKVELLAVERGIRRETITNEAGIYIFSACQPGQYHITVRKDGFRQVDVVGLIVNVQDHLENNIRLQVGSALESVTVTSESAMVNAESAAVSTVIDNKFVDNLPLNGRSFNTLLQLTPGVVIAQNSGAISPGQFSVAGQRTDANNFTVDGVSANFGVISGETPGQSGLGTTQAFSVLGGTSSLVSVEALQEFRIVTSTFAPEFGRVPGGQVALTTKSGTNVVHGGAYEYFRNDVLDANDWFANAAGKPRPPERHNDFGAYLGGPVFPDKTFFFLSYEGARLRLPKAQVTPVPSEYARTTAPQNISPFLTAFPQPDDRTVVPGTYTSPFTGVWSDSSTLNAGSIRIDHTFSNRFSLFGRYNEAPSALVQRNGPTSTNQVTDVNTRTITVGASLFVQNVTNTIRGNYSRQQSKFGYVFSPIAGAVPLDPALIAGSLAPKALVLFQTFDTNGVTLAPRAGNTATQQNFTDDLGITVGSHQVKVGGDYRGIFLDVSQLPYLFFFSANSVEDFTSSGGQGFLFDESVFPAKLYAQTMSIYGQDTWRAGARITITYGLRWEWAPAPSPRGSTRLASWQNVGNPAAIALAPFRTAVWKTKYANFAPRIGVAYGLRQNGDLVIRGGAGIFYDLGLGQAASLSASFPNQFTNFASVSLPIGDPTPILPSTSIQPPYPGVYAFDPGLTLPRSYQWNIALEESFGGHQAFSATYAGQAGRDILRGNSYFQPNANFSSFFQLDKNNARSNYNSLQLQFRKPLSSHVQALLNYTYAHSLDNSSNDIFGGANTIISAANDYASSDFDVRHTFSGAFRLESPQVPNTSLSRFIRNWSLDGVVVARKGFPLNAKFFALSPVTGYAFARPDRVVGQPSYLEGAQCTAAFSVRCPGGRALNPNAFTGTVGDGRTPAGTIPVDANGNPLRQGTETRNDIRGFGLFQVDLSVSRKFALTERVMLEFRTDAFNVFNHPNFAAPDTDIHDGPEFGISRQMLNQGLGGLNPLFQQGGPRSLQLSARLNF